MTISVVRGDTKTVTVTYTENSSAYDLTSHTVYFTVKKKSDQDVADRDAVIQKSFTSGDATGIATFTLSKTDTRLDYGEYVYNVRLVNAAGTLVLSTAEGTFTVSKGVTQRVS